MKKTGMKIGAVLLASLLLAGCGEGEKSLTQQGMEAVSQQEYRSALDCFSRAIRAGEDKEESYRGMGLAYMGQQQYDRALGSFLKALREAGVHPGELEYDINYYMAICYYKTGEYDEAIACYDAITELRKKETRAWFLKGSMKLYLGDVEGALSDFDTALSVKKNDYSLYLDIYDSLHSHGYETQAEQYLSVVKEANTKEISDYDKGRLCFYTGAYAQACNYLERARNEGRADAELITLLGECYRQQGQFDYAAVVYNAYVDEHNDAEICNRLGLMLAGQNDYEQALEAFRRGKEIRENNTCMQELRYNEIVCCEYLQLYEEAAELLDAYTETYGSSALLEKEHDFLVTR